VDERFYSGAEEEDDFDEVVAELDLDEDLI